MRFSLQRHYEILGLPPGSGIEEVKKAYRKKALQLHPDVNASPDANQRFIELNESYETLVYFLSGKVYDKKKGGFATPAKKHKVSHEEWQRRYREKARRRAEEELKANYYKFKKSGYYRRSLRSEAIILAVAIAFVLFLGIGVPVLVELQHGYGFITFLVINFFALNMYIVTYKSLKKEYKNRLRNKKFIQKIIEEEQAHPEQFRETAEHILGRESKRTGETFFTDEKLESATPISEEEIFRHIERLGYTSMPEEKQLFGDFQRKVMRYHPKNPKKTGDKETFIANYTSFMLIWRHISGKEIFDTDLIEIQNKAIYYSRCGFRWALSNNSIRQEFIRSQFTGKFIYFVYPLFILSLLTTIDFIIPLEPQEDMVSYCDVHQVRSRRSYGERFKVIHTQKGFSFKSDRQHHACCVYNGDTLKLSVSPLFHFVHYYSLKNEHFNTHYIPHYGWAIPCCLFFIFLASAGFLFFKSRKIKINFSVVLILALIFLVGLLLI